MKVFSVKGYSRAGGIYCEIVEASNASEALRKGKDKIKSYAFGKVVKFSVVEGSVS